ncbi:hypothetical protein BDP27DRAFT_1312338 [Rhodocollybia butyracea]|uniref:Uncharacterized protein n=1 Tax=Rhodocollybia butyracea TaxID=206335 RepID=A0A9P5Q9X1_9AGAR|nr:hypothetical protein BDP27DRAFT_1312338 [Rhodocollybia butyracea]
MSTFIADGFNRYTCFGDSDMETLVGVEGAMTDTWILGDLQCRFGSAVLVLDDEERDLSLVRPRIEGQIIVL